MRVPLEETKVGILPQLPKSMRQIHVIWFESMTSPGQIPRPDPENEERSGIDMLGRNDIKIYRIMLML
jgi:hypothetical protein